MIPQTPIAWLLWTRTATCNNDDLLTKTRKAISPLTPVAAMVAIAMRQLHDSGQSEITVSDISKHINRTVYRTSTEGLVYKNFATQFPDSHGRAQAWALNQAGKIAAVKAEKKLASLILRSNTALEKFTQLNPGRCIAR